MKNSIVCVNKKALGLTFITALLNRITSSRSSITMVLTLFPEATSHLLRLRKRPADVTIRVAPRLSFEYRRIASRWPSDTALWTSVTFFSTLPYCNMKLNEALFLKCGLIGFLASLDWLSLSFDFSETDSQLESGMNIKNWTTWIRIFCFFTAGKRSLRRLCIYTCLSFCP